MPAQVRFMWPRISAHARSALGRALGKTLLALLASAAASTASGQDATPRADQSRQKPPELEEVVRVESALVNLFLTALDGGGRFVTSLKPTDIRVTQGGVTREIFSFVPATARPLTVVLLVDLSQSQAAKLPEERKVAAAFLERVVRPGRDRVGVVSFGPDPMLEQAVTADVGAAKAAVGRLRTATAERGYEGAGVHLLPEAYRSTGDPSLRGTTALWDAVYFTCRDILSPPASDARKVIVLLTDGEDTSSRAYLEDAVEEARLTETVIYAIGVGDRRYPFGAEQRQNLRKVAELTGGLALFPDETPNLKKAFGEVEKLLRAQYLVAFAPAPESPVGRRLQVEIELTNPKLREKGVRLSHRLAHHAARLTDNR